MSQKTERLVNLTIALLETRLPLSFTQIQQKTGYYADQDHDAARRMFERDKDDLRRMGVPVDTQPIPYSEDVGYIVSRKQYELADPLFSSEEMAALALAQQYSTSADVSLAFAKIAARAPDPDRANLAPTLDLRVTDSLYPPDVLAQAIIERVTVSFFYDTPRSEPAVRTVNPYALARRRGRWYLVGYDRDRDGLRAYRLDRISGDVTHVTGKKAFDPPEKLDLIHELLPPPDEHVRIAGHISPTFVAQMTARGAVITGEHAEQATDSWLSFTLDDVDMVRDVPWLLEFGDQVKVTSPPQVVAEITQALDLLATNHRGAL
jgi:predicted DNA-binding transcriptional regulator YafY